MTLKYESEILFDLMKRDGDDTPSDVLPYESELKEKYLQQVEGAYPKLQDYRPEWLNYNLNAHLPADFPVESVSNVTNATFENVVPYAYGSAILKGQTLVNLVGEKRLYINNNGINPTLYGWEFMLPYNLTKGKTYLAVFNATGTIDKTNSKVYLMDNGFDSDTGNGDYPVDFKAGYNVVKCVASGDNHKVLRIRTTAETLNDLEVSDVMLIEYQDGMENWVIPYFEGMQSVKMPVLKAIGKNLFYSTLEYGDFNNSTGIPSGSSKTIIRTKEYNEISPNKTYRITVFNGIATAFIVHEYDNDFNYIKTGNANVFTTNANTKYVKFRFRKSNTAPYTEEELATLSCMITVGDTIPDTYEPHKSNILSTPSDLELRGIGDVKDTLDCLTGQVTQRIGEFVLDGSENWTYTSDWVKGETIGFYLFNNKSNGFCLSDKFAFYLGINNVDFECISFPKNAWIGIRIKVDKLETQDVNGFKKYLSTNNVVVQYDLNEEVIKTVDLTVTDQDGNTTSIITPIEGTMHLMTEGDTIKPLFSGEIPVEATTQNLMSFANILEEE